jgi:hypothetical protein
MQVAAGRFSTISTKAWIFKPFQLSGFRIEDVNTLEYAPVKYMASGTKMGHRPYLIKFRAL